MKTQNFDESQVKFWLSMFRPRTKKYLRHVKRNNRIMNNPFKAAGTIEAQNEAIRRILD